MRPLRHHPRRTRVARLTRAAVAVAGALALAPPVAAHAAVGTLTTTGLSSPAGAVWLPDAAGNGQLWVSDHLRGFCRVEGSGLTSCVTAAASPGQPSFDPSRNLVYVPDNSAKSIGVLRLTWDPTIGSFADSSVIVPALAGNRPTATTVDGSGALYVGFLKNGTVSRVAAPYGPTPAALSVAASSDARRVFGMVTRGADLYLAETAGVTRVGNISACSGGCRAATVLGLSVPAPLSIAYDSGGDRLFVGTTNSVVRFAPGTRVQETLANTGTYPDGTTVPLANVSAVAVTPGDTLAVGDDTTGGAQVLTGRLWGLAAGGTAVAGGGGAPPPPPPPPPPAASSTAGFVASGLTAPAGALWLPDASGSGHLWVADHLRGLCMVDTAAQAIVAGTCNTAALSPGQPSFDAARNLVYVPDNSAKSAGVLRLSWDPGTESFVGDTVLAPTFGLGGNRPTTSALGPDGRLYVGFLKNGNVVRVTGPDTGTQTVQSVGATSDGSRSGGFAFRGADLYIAQSTTVGKIAGATAGTCTGGCRAVAGTVNVSTAASPLSLAYDAGRDALYVGDKTAGVVKYAFATRAQSVLANTGTSTAGSDPLSNVSALALDGTGQTLFVGDDPSAGATSLSGRLWQVTPGA